MLEHARFLAHALSTPWALERSQLAVLTRIAARLSIGEQASPAALSGAAETQAARDARRTQGRSVAAGVGVIPIHGVIMQRAGMYDQVSGLVSTQQISAALQDALNDDAVSSIVLDIDSPGGSVFGVQELADEISQANAKKPVIAIANSLAASAAYWLGSQASEFYVTPSGMVGSIGVYAAHEDYSKALEEAGIKTTLVSAGRYKTEGNSFEALAPEAREFMQSQIDSYYQSFTRQVARGRNVPVATVRGGMGQGRTLTATEAKSNAMVDGIATFGQTLARARQLRAGQPAGARALAPIDGRSEEEMRRARARAAARGRNIDLLELM